MLSVAIHKDIAEYQPKVIGKLTGRTLISITVAFCRRLYESRFEDRSDRSP